YANKLIHFISPIHSSELLLYSPHSPPPFIPLFSPLDEWSPVSPSFLQLATDTSSYLLTMPSSSLVMDSVVVHLPDMEIPDYTGAADGRFIFMLGDPLAYNGSKLNDLEDDLSWDQSLSFELYAVDLFLSKSFALGQVGDLYSFGSFIRYYLIDERTFVITDYNKMENVLRQRLVKIDWAKETAECDFYRTYAVVLEPCSIVVGDEWATVDTDDNTLVRIPVNPLSTESLQDITVQKDQNSEIERHVYGSGAYRRGQVNPALISFVNAPFIITSSVVGFCVINDDDYDINTVLVLDLTSGTCYMQDVTSSPSFPFKTITNFTFHQAHDREALFFVEYEDGSIGGARLNTRTLEWSEMVDEGWHTEEDETVIKIRNCDHLVMISEAPEVGESRVIGENIEEGELRRLRVFRHPRRVSSLLQLATIAVQRSGRVCEEQFKLIVTRIQVPHH
ncbi:hypothetical protein PENTCL1PPCAC_27686, partial [Pristionchus entomophagus]